MLFSGGQLDEEDGRRKAANADGRFCSLLTQRSQIVRPERYYCPHYFGNPNSETLRARGARERLDLALVFCHLGCDVGSAACVQ